MSHDCIYLKSYSENKSLCILNIKSDCSLASGEVSVKFKAVVGDLVSGDCH